MKQKYTLQPKGNYFDKYHSSNPVAKKLMSGFFSRFDKLLEYTGHPKTILDAGCGEGYVSVHIEKNIQGGVFIDAFDLSETIIAEAKSNFPQINFFTNSIYTCPKKQYDLVIASEVLEHLERPADALGELIKASSNYILISVPNEPLWRILNMARGKYWNEFGNTPGHIQHWSIHTLMKFVSSFDVQVVAVEKPLPWIMLLLKKR